MLGNEEGVSVRGHKDKERGENLRSQRRRGNEHIECYRVYLSPCPHDSVDLRDVLGDYLHATVSCQRSVDHKMVPFSCFN